MEELAWAAGFFDGEGCFSYTPRGSLMATIGQVAAEPLERFQGATGVGNVRGPYPAREGTFNKNPQHVYLAYGANASQVMQRLWPWLSEVKKTSALRAVRKMAVDRPTYQRGWLPSTVDREQMVWRARSRESLAWAAGFFDAEGCFSRSERARYRIVSITQTEAEMLERFRSTVGFGKILGPYRSPIQDGYVRKPIFLYRANKFEQVQAIAAMLWFRLGTAKKEQAVAVLGGYAFCKRGHRKGRSRGCPTCLSAYWRTRRERGDFIREAWGDYDAPPWPWRSMEPIDA